MDAAEFLRVPPFPGANICHFATTKVSGGPGTNIAAEIKRLRVGGSFWAKQPEVPNAYVLATSALAVERATELADGLPVVLWNRASDAVSDSHAMVTGACDPWHMLSGASALVTHAGDELLVIAALLDLPCFDVNGRGGKFTRSNRDVARLLEHELSALTFENPFTGGPMTALETVELCGFWRRLIDSNRNIAGGIGFAFWKQRHVAPLLWNGSSQFRFMRDAEEVGSGGTVAVWRTKVPEKKIFQLARNGARLIEVEDGFLRSRGLGADCIPPLSITVDRLGAYFDPTRASELECLLQEGEFDDSLLARARVLRRLIVEAGLGKYEQGNAVLDRPAGERRHILVPGQVEDDRAVLEGGCGLASNLELIRRVRQRAPDAFILYKPHPDVVAGHRRGAVPQAHCLEFADQIVAEAPISSLIAMVDEIHVNTSLAGFEALLREKPVTTYGVPFYAGWGLTLDVGPVPERRSKTRTLDELVAAVLLLYPRYLDPNSGLPCPPEVIVSRLTATDEQRQSLIVNMRRFQGRFMRRLRSVLQ